MFEMYAGHRLHVEKAKRFRITGKSSTVKRARVSFGIFQRLSDGKG